MVMALLYLALRSGRLVVAAVVTLLYGLLLTASFAAAAVGHLNLISIAFSVLYVGLGIDYALYLCMQYRELLGGGLAQREALPRAAGDVGGFMMVCAATTSLGFFAFIPTPFTGIAELGIISGAGMFISLAVSLTVLPALISLFPPNAARVKLNPPGSGVLGEVLSWPYKYSRTIWIGAALLAAGSALLAPRARFDYDPIDLRDPNSESVSTFRDLLRDPNIPTLTLSVLVPDAAQAQALSQKLGALPLVRHAVTLLDLVPGDQDTKLGIISDLNLTLGPAVMGRGGPVQITPRADDYASIHQLGEALPAYIEQNKDKPVAASAQKLLTALQGLDSAWQNGDSAAHEQLLGRLRNGLLSALPPQIDRLRDALQAAHVSERDLPDPISRRWKSADGEYRIEVQPREVLDGPGPMERFVNQVRTAAPNVSGGAVGYIESGHAVVGAFRQAFVYSFIAITILLLLMLRSFADTLLVLIPLGLAGLLTVAGSVLLNVPFNFANVIALPLILGVGVDYGVYLAQRGRVAASAHVNLLQTGTARAVLFGALITTANFGNLMLAKHPGIVSMGLLLTIGLSMTLICALVLLPSLLARRYGRPQA
jgi:hopanoid biosynthesis associated RND transporter like protein HpnN